MSSTGDDAAAALNKTDGDTAKGRGGDEGGWAGESGGGLRTAWMIARLQPETRSALKERQEKVRRALEDVRRFAGTRGAIFVLPRVGVETGAAAAVGWDLQVVPSQRDVVRGAIRVIRGGFK